MRTWHISSYSCIAWLYTALSCAYQWVIYKFKLIITRSTASKQISLQLKYTHYFYKVINKHLPHFMLLIQKKMYNFEVFTFYFPRRLWVLRHQILCTQKIKTDALFNILNNSNYLNDIILLSMKNNIFCTSLRILLIYIN